MRQLLALLALSSCDSDPSGTAGVVLSEPLAVYGTFDAVPVGPIVAAVTPDGAEHFLLRWSPPDTEASLTVFTKTYTDHYVTRDEGKNWSVQEAYTEEGTRQAVDGPSNPQSDGSDRTPYLWTLATSLYAHSGTSFKRYDGSGWTTLDVAGAAAGYVDAEVGADGTVHLIADHLPLDIVYVHRFDGSTLSTHAIEAESTWRPASRAVLAVGPDGSTDVAYITTHEFNTEDPLWEETLRHNRVAADGTVTNVAAIGLTAAWSRSGRANPTFDDLELFWHDGDLHLLVTVIEEIPPGDPSVDGPQPGGFGLLHAVMVDGEWSEPSLVFHGDRPLSVRVATGDVGDAVLWLMEGTAAVETWWWAELVPGGLGGWRPSPRLDALQERAAFHASGITHHGDHALSLLAVADNAVHGMEIHR